MAHQGASDSEPYAWPLTRKVFPSILLLIMDGDKRTEPRFSFSEPVTFTLPELNTSGSLAGDISFKGISLKVYDFVPIGTTLELQLRLGRSPRVIMAKAQVVRIREVFAEDCYEIGLKFVRDEEVTKAVGAYIVAHRSQK